MHGVPLQRLEESRRLAAVVQDGGGGVQRAARDQPEPVLLPFRLAFASLQCVPREHREAGDAQRCGREGLPLQECHNLGCLAGVVRVEVVPRVLHRHELEELDEAILLEVGEHFHQRVGEHRGGGL
eukprot:CAMPEP_0182806740 /NCGR_PEP_ID=MMETSP0006_2-20121128/5761_1 /TAXON_ID=97485 /ORGANISM="Prymnesium parvum, Strain Texoma1" /LENGTH=125 /DNA_ID=CAMNT_0024932377 /DNA_START=381 /DNA_END=758 /DNA_ORIENTATION=-